MAHHRMVMEMTKNSSGTSDINTNSVAPPPPSSGPSSRNTSGRDITASSNPSFASSFASTTSSASTSADADLENFLKRKQPAPVPFSSNHSTLSREEVIDTMKREMVKRCEEHNKANRSLAEKEAKKKTKAREEALKKQAATKGGEAPALNDGGCDPDLNFPLQIDSDNFFSSQYIASCFWLPRKPEYGGKRWLEDALFIFAQCRNYDFEKATKRFFKFNAVAFPTRLQSLDEMPLDVQQVLGKAGCFGMSPTPDSNGLPIIYITCTHFSWEGIPVPAAQRAHIWMFWQWTQFWGPNTAQCRGVTFVVSWEGVNSKQINMDFERWCNSIIVQCLPVRTAAIYMAYEPFLFGKVLWPIMKRAMSVNMRSRVLSLGNKPEKVGPRFRALTYSDVDPVVSRAVIPTELGGDWRINQESSTAFFSQWKVSDEKVPGNCALVSFLASGEGK